MATASDLQKILIAMEENNRKLSEAIVAVAADNSRLNKETADRNMEMIKDMKSGGGRRWEDLERYKNIKHFGGKP
jgi:hypothetical protein